MSQVSLVSIWVGLIAGNFLYQAFAGGDYGIDVDRSFFQAAALVTVWIVQKLVQP